MSDEPNKSKPGPAEDCLKIDMNWEDGAKRLMGTDSDESSSQDDDSSDDLNKESDESP